MWSSVQTWKIICGFDVHAGFECKPYTIWHFPISVCWYVHVLRREDGHVLKRALHFEVSINKIAAGLRRIWSPSFGGDTTRFWTLVSLSLFHKLF